MIKKIIVIILFLVSAFTMFTACSIKNARSSEIPSIEGFSNEELTEIAKYGNVSILNETDFDTIDTAKYKIIYIDVSQKDRTKIMSNLQKYFKDSEYQLFYTSISLDNGPEKVCLLKSKDKYDVLRAFKTNGINYDIDTDTLIDKIKTWDSQYKIKINGVDGDWVDISLENLPSNLEEFADEIYNFCPDSVDQGVGDINELINVLKNDKEIILWWD